MSRILWEQYGKNAGGWELHLHDKRETYARTHRLRMDPAPYREIQRDLDDPRFDALILFLEEHDFAPEVNLLEEKLSSLLAELGVRKSVLEVRSFAELRRMYPGELTIVAADSVHSVVREWANGVERVRHTHERVARLRVVGPDVPSRLGLVDQVRLSKVLGSVVDYRRNRNGFAEVDLFLTAGEHEAVRALGASPREPVKIESKMLRSASAPLFRAIVEHLERPSRELFLYSTFELEHAVTSRLAFQIDGVRVFLVGDAAVSLPFFRGMACLARCAHRLARVHRDLAAGEERDPIGRYERETASVKRDEMRVVRSRAQLVRVLREIVRVSALLPFPIQSWWLSAEDRDRRPAGVSLALFGNMVLAILAGLAVYFDRFAIACPIELLGGVAYHASISFERGPHRLLRLVWQLQIAAVLVYGVSVAVHGSRVLPATWWFLLGGAFAIGLVLYERLLDRHFRHAALDR
ncbi:MAG: hypothetical protein ACXVEF_22145 [Polyangiales bacterium]